MELCHNLISIYGSVDPGRSNQLTNVNFELNCAKVIETKMKLDRKLINRSDAMVRFMKIN
jgi:hypothetical protein